MKYVNKIILYYNINMARQKQKQKQKQSQKVIVNIGTQVTKRKKRKTGARKAPSSQVNIQPIVLPQTDYSPLILAMMEQNKSQNQTKNINVPSLLENNPTPLSLSSRPPAEETADISSRPPAEETADISSRPPAEEMAGKAAERRARKTAEEMAGKAAERRAGKTADNFQPLPSQADERFSIPYEDTPFPDDEEQAELMFEQEDDKVRPPDPDFTERLVKSEPYRPPLAESWPTRGRPRADITIGVKEGDPEPKPKPQPVLRIKLIKQTTVTAAVEEMQRLGIEIPKNALKEDLFNLLRQYEAQITERRAMGAEDKPIVSPTDKPIVSPTRGRSLIKIKKKKTPRSRSTNK
jgi:hypothetical protein